MKEMPSWSASLVLFATIFFILLTILYYEEILRIALRRNTPTRHPNENNLNEPPSQLQSVGLASAIIHSLPAIQFQEGFKRYDDQGNTDCAVCLGEFVEGEWLRLLPNCAHLFHLSCIDAWFASHSTCPLCRKNVVYDTGLLVSESRMMENQEVRHVVEIESDESVSSELGGSDNRTTTEYTEGETSGSATNVQVMSVSPEDISSNRKMRESCYEQRTAQTNSRGVFMR